MALAARKYKFDELPDGRIVWAVTLSNTRGTSATLMNYGATLQAFHFADRNGEIADIALGHSRIAPYLASPQYMGATVGRVANRIANARFSIDGRRYNVLPNDGENALHGGAQGFDQQLWSIEYIGSETEASATFGLLSPDGDQGFPGNLRAAARYTLDEDDRLTISYEATTDHPTVVAITNHAYWNLAGEGSARSALDHCLTIEADHYLPVDATLIPTGERRAVAGTVFEFREERRVGERVRDADDLQIINGRGYDHCWVVEPASSGALHRMAKVEDPHSGRGFELWSNQLGLQFYSGNFLDGTTIGKAGHFYRSGDAIVLEPQSLPDCVNQPSLGSALLDPGQTYRNIIEYRFLAR